MRRNVTFRAPGTAAHHKHHLLFAALITASGIGCAKSDDGAAKEAPTDTAQAASARATVSMTSAQVQHGGVEWSAAVAASARTVLELPGQLVPNEDHTAYLGAPAEGRVVSVQVRPGDRVAAGQSLVTLQSGAATDARADFSKATAGLNAARASAAFARAARERAERLLVVKAASREEVEHAQTNDEVAQGALQQAEAELSRARTAREQLGATSAEGTMILRSPLRGVVLSRDATPGSVAAAGAPLVAVTDPATLWLEIAVSDRQIGALRQGARVRFSVPAFPADSFEARVQSVGGALDTTSRTVPVRALVVNKDGRLRPAMFATTFIEGGETRQVVSLPSDAVQLLDNRAVVFVARADGKGGATFERRDVDVGTSAGGRVEVVRGLSAGEMVVTSGAFAIKSEFARSKMAGG